MFLLVIPGAGVQGLGGFGTDRHHADVTVQREYLDPVFGEATALDEPRIRRQHLAPGIFLHLAYGLLQCHGLVGLHGKGRRKAKCGEK